MSVLSYAAVGWDETRLPAQTIVGVAMYISGMGLEWVSEMQRLKFKKDPKHKGQLYTGGLFGLARHINYGGSVLWRAGFAVAAAGWIWGTIVGGWLVYDFTKRAIPELDVYCGKRCRWAQYKSSVRSKLLPFIFTVMYEHDHVRPRPSHPPSLSLSTSLPPPSALSTPATRLRLSISNYGQPNCLFQAFPVKEYEYRLFPLSDHGPPIFVRNSAGSVIHEEHFPYFNLPPLRLSLYPFVATTHAAWGLPIRVPEDPGYVLPIRGMFAILCSSVPKQFTRLHSSRENSNVDVHDSSSNSESCSESKSSSELEPISGSCHTEHERRIHFWLQDTDDTPPDDSTEVS
ncbi:hypothetical protein D9757_012873 [Collybiopsis confluens]|uniref:Steroid 5-alpha reductase C-terminal domain-containing protein n=1 Tax=Collybiopsis confluens TaxID=2823264 RepID=A0A8H5D3F0_9AGAR|nr:hypothetical protein D9757_012873 [Collybiopsis confluens]